MLTLQLTRPRAVRMALFTALAAGALVRAAVAQSPLEDAAHGPDAQLARQPLVVNLQNASERLEMTVNTSRILTLDQKIPKAQVNNPEVLEITPLSPNQVQVLAKKPGVTQVNLWDENDGIHTVDVIVFGDAQELQMVLQTQFPKSTLRVIPLSNSVIVSGYVDRPDIVNRVIQIAEDYHPKVINNIAVGGVQQVLLHVKVMEVSRTKLRTLGVDFAEINANDFVVSGISGVLNGFSAATQTVKTTGGETLTLGVVNGGNSFFGFLEALRENNLLKVMAEPNLVTISGRPSSFNVGGEFPILVPQSLGTVSIQYKKYGTQLDFVPIVLGNGRIRLEVRPRVSEIDNTRSVVINEIAIPGLRVREVETGVEMRAGQTLAIAGLVQLRTEGRSRGLPYLADLPYVGAMFRRNSSTTNEIELLIMVTPELVDAMEPHQVPPGGPGYDTCAPSDCELYWKGMIEVPCCADGRCGHCAHCLNGDASSGMGVPITSPGYGPGSVEGMMTPGEMTPTPMTAPETVPPSAPMPTDPSTEGPMASAPRRGAAPARRYVGNLPVNPNAPPAPAPALQVPRMTVPDSASAAPLPTAAPLPPQPGAMATRPPVVAERPNYYPAIPRQNRPAPQSPTSAAPATSGGALPAAPEPPKFIGPIGYDFE
ncbi:MAG: pilus assembly protein N-terminal domain-containing protein [Pirellulales bacterium]|nr:pilus assembly protein N-terminal domain-containing protein [Pirellulales bacterium]